MSRNPGSSLRWRAPGAEDSPALRALGPELSEAPGQAYLALTALLSPQSTVPGLSYLGVVCVFSYIAGHSIGPSEYCTPKPPGPVPDTRRSQ